jgi:hypothetical protein
MQNTETPAEWGHYFPISKGIVPIKYQDEGITMIGIAAVIVMMIIIIYLIWSSFDMGIAQRLSMAGWVLYLSDGCEFCNQQLKILKTQNYHPSIKCGVYSGDSTHIPCSELTGFPTWYNVHTKEKRVGLQKLHDLKTMADGC